MQDCPSPYALLCASKPKHPPCVSTIYDAYSQVMQFGTAPAYAPQNEPPQDAALSAAAEQKAERHEPVIPHRQQTRTHYIADIKRRHQGASSRRSDLSSPLP